MKCENCGLEIEDKNIKVCPTCGNRVNKDKFPVWVFVLVILTVFLLPILGIIGVVLAIFMPVLFNSHQSNFSKELFKKNVSTLNQALNFSSAINGRHYTKFDDVWDKGLKKYLAVDSEIENGVKLVDLSEVKYKRLNEICSNVPTIVSDINENTACAVLFIDTDGFNKGVNKLSTPEHIKDQFKVLLYANKVVPTPNSVEETLLQTSELKD